MDLKVYHGVLFMRSVEKTMSKQETRAEKIARAKKHDWSNGIPSEYTEKLFQISTPIQALGIYGAPKRTTKTTQELPEDLQNLIDFAEKTVNDPDVDIKIEKHLGIPLVKR